jgi:hypothetical protein
MINSFRNDMTIVRISTANANANVIALATCADVVCLSSRYPSRSLLTRDLHATIVPASWTPVCAQARYNIVTIPSPFYNNRKPKHNSILRISKLTPRSLRLNRQTTTSSQTLNDTSTYSPTFNLFHLDPHQPSQLITHNNHHVLPPRNLPPPIPGHWRPSPPHPTRRLLPNHPHPRHIRLRLRQGRPQRREAARARRQPLRRPRAPRPASPQGGPGQRRRTDQGRRGQLQLRQRLRAVEER